MPALLPFVLATLSLAAPQGQAARPAVGRPAADASCKQPVKAHSSSKRSERPRLLASRCETNPPGATDIDGDDCSAYDGYADSCGCCDDDDFVAARCVECWPEGWQCERPVAEELAKLGMEATEVRMSGLSLTGKLPGNVAELLPNLTVLDLSMNYLEGEIPQGLWSLPHLRELDLSYNMLEGPLPEAVGRAAELRKLWLLGNRLSGRLPPAIGNWRKLEDLDLMDNKFEGELPEAVGAWRHLRSLDLSGIGLSGPIPKAVGNWSEVETVYLETNLFSGRLPVEIGNWRKVKVVHLWLNYLEGPIPSSVGEWREVEDVDWERNKLSGHLPEAMGKWQKLTDLRLGNNNFSGPIPHGVGNWTEVRVVDLGANSFSGSIPKGVGQWRRAVDVSLYDNELTGRLPPAVGNWTQVSQVMLQHNSLSGAIPGEVGSWERVVSVYLDSNNLTGQIPTTVSRWRQVEVVYFSYNALTGELPTGVGAWRKVQMVEMIGNKLAGQIPREIGQWSQVLILQLHNNRFSGPLPPEIAKLLSLRELVLGHNDLEGRLPDLGALRQLTKLELQSNRFSSTGALPASLHHLDLSNNRLAELPPAAFNLVDLEVLLVAKNKITKWPPRGVLVDKVLGSVLICGVQPQEPRFPWARLTTLDASENDLAGTPVRTFLNSVAYVKSLTDLACRNCSLSGVLVEEGELGLADDQPHTGDEDCVGYPPPQAGFVRLQRLDLAGNAITEIDTDPSWNLLTVDLSGNSLKFLRSSWFNADDENRIIELKVFDNKDLRLDVQKPLGRCARSGEKALAADPDAYQELGEGYECTSLCSGRVTRYSTDHELNASALCRCLPGYSGQGRNCTPCGSDSYSCSEEGDRYELRKQCRQCPANSGTRGKERSSSITACQCPPGTYLDETTAACAWCSQWPFRTTPGFGAPSALACSCNASYSGLKEANGFCGCDDGFHMNRKLLRCQECSSAELCVWGTELERSLEPPVVKAGFWSEPVEDLADFARNVVLRCTGRGSCRLGGRCAEGREGPACSLCQAGWYGAPEGPCTPCKGASPQEQRFLLVLAVLSMGLPAVILLHAGLEAEGVHLKGLLHFRAVRRSLKQTVKHLQTVSVIGGFSVSWPGLALAFFKALDSFTLEVPTLLAVGCLEERTSASLEMLAKWAMLPVLALVAVLAMPASWGLAWLMGRLRAIRGLRILLKRLPAPDSFAMALKDVGRTLLFSLLLFWSTLAANSFEMLTCVPSPNGWLTVASYPHIRCSFGDPEYATLALFSLLSVVLYLFVPLRLLYLGYRRSSEQLAATCGADRGWYAFVFDDYRDGHMHWTIVVMVKDLLFVLFPAALPGQGAAQLLLAAALSAFYVCLTAQCMPFKDRSNSLLEAWNGATAAALCIYSVGMGYEQTAGVKDVEELFEGGDNDPLYKGRAVGMVVVQVLAITVPTGMLLYQMLCAVECTRRRLPRCVRPVSPEESQEWIRDFAQTTESLEALVEVLQNCDEEDVYIFRNFIETTSATMGRKLSRKSRSNLVRKANSIESDRASVASLSQPLSQQRSGVSSMDMRAQRSYVSSIPEVPAFASEGAFASNDEAGKADAAVQTEVQTLESETSTAMSTLEMVSQEEPREMRMSL